MIFLCTELLHMIIQIEKLETMIFSLYCSTAMDDFMTMVSKWCPFWYKMLWSKISKELIEIIAPIDFIINNQTT